MFDDHDQSTREGNHRWPQQLSHFLPVPSHDGLILFSSFIQHVRSWCILTSLPTISVKQINNNGKNQKLTRCVTTGSVYLLYLESHKRQLISVFLICWHGVINQESLETTYPPKIIQKQNAILD